MFIVEIDGNTPFERGARNAKVLKPRQKEIFHHFVFAGDRSYKLGMRVDIFYKSGGVFAHFEEIRLFVRLFNLSAAIGTFAVHKLTFRPERFARRTIPAFVRAFVYIAVFIEFIEDFLNLFFVVFVGRTNEFIVRNVH